MSIDILTDFLLQSTMRLVVVRAVVPIQPQRIGKGYIRDGRHGDSELVERRQVHRMHEVIRFVRTSVFNRKVQSLSLSFSRSHVWSVYPELRPQMSLTLVPDRTLAGVGRTEDRRVRSSGCWELLLKGTSVSFVIMAADKRGNQIDELGRKVVSDYCLGSLLPLEVYFGNGRLNDVCPCTNFLRNQ